MCVTVATCNPDGKVSGTAGFNTETCTCNSGYSQTITNTNGTLTKSCKCLTANGLSVQAFTSSSGTSYNYCCPLNASVPTS